MLGMWLLFLSFLNLSQKKALSLCHETANTTYFSPDSFSGMRLKSRMRRLKH